MTLRSKPTIDWIDRLAGLDESEGLTVAPILRRTSAAAAVKGELETLRSINARLLREIDALKEREAHALMLADRDGLTGLYNRRRMSELLDQTILDAAEIGRAHV